MAADTPVAPGEGWAERALDVMGTSARIIVDGPVGLDTATLVEGAADRLRMLEQRWSRFLPTSEVSHLNACAGRPRRVSADTLRLCLAAREAWQRSCGLVDPLLGRELSELGYDRSFAQLHGPHAGGDRLHPPHCYDAVGWSSPSIGGRMGHRTELDVLGDVGVVWLPRDATLDPGGIGKGLAADLIAAELESAGADWIVVELGGDIRVAGSRVAYWGAEIEIVDPATDSIVARLRLHGGGVATSTTLRRRWYGPDGELHHHLLDPRTGRPATSDVATATVVAGTAFAAEVEAKAAVLRGRVEAVEHLNRSGLTGLLITAAGEVLTVAGAAGAREADPWPEEVRCPVR